MWSSVGNYFQSSYITTNYFSSFFAFCFEGKWKQKNKTSLFANFAVFQGIKPYLELPIMADCGNNGTSRSAEKYRTKRDELFDNCIKNEQRKCRNMKLISNYVLLI